MSAGIKAIAQKLQEKGRGNDTILAHIMPEEAALLKRMGGRGSRNPETGLLEFDNPSMGAYDAPSSSGVSPGLSGFGGGSSSPSGVSGGGFSSSGGGSYSSTDGGGWSPSGGGGRDSMASARTADRMSVPSYSADVPAPIGGGGGTFGMPTLLSNAASTVGQALLNFSDQSTALIRDVYNNPMNYVPSFGSPGAAGYYGDIPSAVSSLPGAMDVRGHVENPKTFTAPGYTDYANAVGDINFLSPRSLDVPQNTVQQVNAPPAPTSTTNAYNFTPNYEGFPEEEAGLRSQRFRISNQQTFDEMAGRRREIDFPEVVNAADLYGVNANAGIASLQPRPMSMPDIRPTTSLLADRQMTMPDIRPTSAPQPAPLGSSLEELMGTVPAGNPMFPNMAFTKTVPTVPIGTERVPSSFNVNVPAFIDAAYKANMGAGLFYSTPESMYNKILSTLPEKGVRFTPGTAQEGQVPRTGIASYVGTPTPSDVPQDATAARQEYDQFMKNYGAALTPRSVTGVSLDMSQPGQRAIPDVSGGVGPQGFGDVPLSSDLGTSVATTLDSYFDELSQGLTGQAPRPSVLGPGQFEAPERGAMTYPGVSERMPSIIDYSNVERAVGGTPIYAEAKPFSGPQSRTALSDAARWAGGGLFSDVEELNNLPSGYLGKLYGIESTFGKNLTTPLSSAAGPFQFTKATGRQYGLFDGGVDSRMDLLQSAAAAGALAADNAKVLERALGRTPSAGELYLAHQQGAAGAVSLLRNPSSSAYNALKRAYGGDEDLAMQALVNNRGSLSMTAGEFANLWTSKMDRAPTAPSGGYDTMFAQRAPAPAVTPTITPAQVAQEPALTGDFLDAEFQRVIDRIGTADLPAQGAREISQNVFEDTGDTVSYPTGGRDGGRSYIPRRDVVEEVTPPEAGAPVSPPVYTTGMDLTRRAYVPSGLVRTASPAYS